MVFDPGGSIVRLAVGDDDAGHDRGGRVGAEQLADMLQDLVRWKDRELLGGEELSGLAVLRVGTDVDDLVGRQAVRVERAALEKIGFRLAPGKILAIDVGRDEVFEAELLVERVHPAIRHARPDVRPDTSFPKRREQVLHAGPVIEMLEKRLAQLRRRFGNLGRIGEGGPEFIFRERRDFPRHELEQRREAFLRCRDIAMDGLDGGGQVVILDFVDGTARQRKGENRFHRGTSMWGLLGRVGDEIVETLFRLVD